MTTMNLTEYARWRGMSYATARRRFEAADLPHPATRDGRQILVEVPDNELRQPRPRQQLKPTTVAYVAGNSSQACVKRVNTVRDWAESRGMRIETAAADDDGSFQHLRELLADPSVTRIITDHAPFESDLLAAALSAQGRELITTTAAPQRGAAPIPFKPRIASSAGA